MMDAPEIKGLADSVLLKLSPLIANNTFLKKLAYNLLVEEELNLEIPEEKEVFEYRKDICNKCPHNIGNVCQKCGCLLDVKQIAKTNFSIKKGKMEVTHCVLGKWKDQNLVVFYNQ